MRTKHKIEQYIRERIKATFNSCIISYPRCNKQSLRNYKFGCTKKTSKRLCPPTKYFIDAVRFTHKNIYARTRDSLQFLALDHTILFMIKNDQILRFLQKYIDTRIETVAIQGNDYLDVHDVHIGGLVTLVKKVYAAGHKAGYEEGLSAEDATLHISKH